MSIVEIEVREYESKPREWILSKTRLDKINLVVGKNATGKTRLLNVVNSLSALLSGHRKKLFSSGDFDVLFEFDGMEYRYKLVIEDKKVKYESLDIDGSNKLERDASGSGQIFAEELDAFLKIKMPSDAIVCVQKRDELQHPFLERLFVWANNTRHYKFGTDFGKSVLSSRSILEIPDSEMVDNNDTDNALYRFQLGYRRYGKDFKTAILNDLDSLGYPCVDIFVNDISGFLETNQPFVALCVQELGLSTPTNQMEMSQGMFRALSLSIHMNFNLLKSAGGTLLIDDIGEGLDYERASSVINLIVDKCKGSDYQVIMTSNDRFVMNAVPLDYWNVLSRKGNVVQSYNKYNSSRQFEEFKFVGLNNFEFFSEGFFEDGLGEN